MDKITKIVEILTDKEVRLIRQYYASKGRLKLNKRFQLFEMVLKNTQISDMEAAAFLGKKPGDTAYSMIKKRLHDDIIKVTLWEYIGSPQLAPRMRAMYQCRLLVMEVEWLMLRGANALAREQVKKAKKLADYYNFNNEKVIINDYLISMVAVREGFQAYNKYAIENSSHFDLLQLRHKAQDYFRQITLPNLFQTNKEVSRLSAILHIHQQLQALYQAQPVRQVAFYYYRSQVYISHLQRDYSQALEFALRFKHFIENDPGFLDNDNLGGAYLQLTNVCLYSYRFHDALQYAMEGAGIFNKGSTNYVSILELAFKAQFYLNNIPNAQLLLQQIQSNKNVVKNQALQAIYQYYRAQCLFRQRQFAECVQTLQTNQQLFHDKSGWRIGIKITELMCLVELGQQDWLEYRIETFRKLLQDLKKENIARPKLVFTLFKAYIKHGYHWQTVLLNQSLALQQLEAGANTYYWDPAGYEMLRFDTWLREKAEAEIPQRSR